mmetsp:Transcript_1046/g.3186  ORF Transcript_1046/g.3186 Transcript_1046/m.3186 type:complete len:253 (+) Transcript_1046:369-1127(+)
MPGEKVPRLAFAPIIVPEMLLHIPHQRPHHPHPVLARRQDLAPLFEFSKAPRFCQRTPPYHHSRNVIVLHAVHGLVQGQNIAVADYRERRVLSDAFDEIPVGRLLVPLLRGPPVDRQSGNSGLLQRLHHTFDVDVVDPDPHLDFKRHGYTLYHSLDQPGQLLRLLEQGGPEAAPGRFVDRTPHVQRHEIGPVARYLDPSLNPLVNCLGGYLDAERRLVCRPTHQCPLTRLALVQIPGKRHLAIQHGGIVVSA